MPELTIEHAGGKLAATLHPADAPVAVLVHGSGPGDRQALHTYVQLLHSRGFAVLAYDKPGCGGSSGDWRAQTLHDRGAEVRAVVAALGDDRRVVLVGGSQGGWVSLIAAAGRDDVAAVVTMSGPGVSVAEQELYRIATDLPRAGFAPDDVAAAVAFLQRRVDAVTAGRPVEEIRASEEPYDDAPWRAEVGETTLEELVFEARAYGYDPAADLRAVRCPLLGIWGGADTIVPVARSVERYLANMADTHPLSTLVVVPNADHRLRLPGADAPSPQAWDTIANWLHRAVGSGLHP